jgi:site-specific recombinase XerD
VLIEKRSIDQHREGFQRIRVHELKHTFGRPLRAAGVGFETRQALLGHHNGSMTTHYSAAEIAELLDAVNRIKATRNTPAMTLLRAVA